MVTRGNQLRYRHGDAQEAIGLDVVMGTGRRGKRKFRPAQVDCKRGERTLDEEVKKSQYGHPAASPSVFEELGIRRCRVVLERLQESIFEPASKDQITSSSTTSGPTAMSDIPNSTGTLVSSVVMDTRPESESEILSVEDPGEVLDTGILSPQVLILAKYCNFISLQVEVLQNFLLLDLTPNCHVCYAAWKFWSHGEP